MLPRSPHHRTNLAVHGRVRKGSARRGGDTVVGDTRAAQPLSLGQAAAFGVLIRRRPGKSLL